MFRELDSIQILHVEDNPDFADLTADMLERKEDRFDVTTANSVGEGLEAYDDTIDCIVSDYNMPGRNGIEFLETIRDRCPEVPFILFTGNGSETIASEAITAGVTDYLQKQSGAQQYTVLANRIRNAVDQYRSRRALESKQERLSLLIEQSPLGVIEYNDDFEIVRMNEAGEQILGYSERELRGETWEKLVTTDSYDHVDEVTSKLAAAEGGYHSIDENRRKDGETIICEWHNRVVTDDDGDVVTVFSLFQDITERRRRQERLEQTTDRLEALFENSPDMINIHDLDGNILDPNPRLCEKTGYDKAELEGMKVWDIDAALDEEMAKELFSRLDTGESHRVEGAYEHSDGSTFPVEVHARRVMLEGEERFVVIGRDISERKESETRLEQQRDNLEILNQMVRHDIRNDLQLIMTHLDLLAPHVDEAGNDHIMQIRESTDRAVTLTETAREMADVMLTDESDRQPTALKPILVREIDDTRSSYPEADIETDGSVPNVEVLANDVLNSVFRNILENAVQHNDGDDPQIRASVRPLETTVRVRIADNGSDIPEDHIEEMFGKGKKGLTSEGSGIGLHLVNTLVDRYGGAVWVDHDDPIGKAFVVELPRAT